MDLCLCLQSDVRLSAIVITSLRRAYAELRPTSKENCSSLAYKCDCSTGARLNTHEQTTSGAQRQHGHVVVSCAPAPNANSHAVGLDDDHALVYVHRVRVMCQSPGKDTLGQKTVYIFFILLLPLFFYLCRSFTWGAVGQILQSVTSSNLVEKTVTSLPAPSAPDCDAHNPTVRLTVKVTGPSHPGGGSGASPPSSPPIGIPPR